MAGKEASYQLISSVHQEFVCFFGLQSGASLPVHLQLETATADGTYKFEVRDNKRDTAMVASRLCTLVLAATASVSAGVSCLNLEGQVGSPLCCGVTLSWRHAVPLASRP